MSGQDDDQLPTGRATPARTAAAGARRRTVRGLLLPADEQRVLAVIDVRDSARDFSDAIGGGLLEEIHHGVVAGHNYCVYGDEDRVCKRLATNARGTIIAAHLGWMGLTERLDLFGDLLVVGAASAGRDTDVPSCLLEAVARQGLLA